MNRQDFSYTLPEHLIAHHPISDRDGSRLMILNRNTGIYEHKMFTNIVDILQPGDCLVINNTKVIPARLRGNFAGKSNTAESGGEVELLLHQRIDEHSWEVLCKPGRKCQPGTKLIFGGGAIVAEVTEIVDDGLRNVTMTYEGDWDELLDQYGEVPLPPYIKPEDTSEDTKKERYNTVYAEHEGSVAAPTAGLHFTDEILEKLKSKGIDIAGITLHVGLGTFRPVKADNITEHHMHSEYYRVEQSQADIINRTKEKGGRVIAVGTTSCRTLESCVDSNGQITFGTGRTDIYIYPGFEFKAIDGLLTNFHLPESTLIMLVSAFCNRENVLAAYEAAIAEEYRFFSFGDAMLLLP
ncbi:MAG: tRNA preQ1(34) S-adenosylmethionine ribosyltransferase-isomerase QueA [Defluviitaleaceae bacterium]|nr:tRNA preQ1(34) S-adenosylmethionine ribosyltransferase-isomerase QueA [Defluviitaleaceae bacterium]